MSFASEDLMWMSVLLRYVEGQIENVQIKGNIAASATDLNAGDGGDKSDTAAHDFVWKTDKDATKNSAGLKHEECSVCGATRSENTVIDKLNNASDTGDSSILILWVALAVVSGAIACLAVYAKKQKYFG